MFEKMKINAADVTGVIKEVFPLLALALALVMFVGAVSAPYLVTSNKAINVTKTEQVAIPESTATKKIVYADGTTYVVGDSMIDLQWNSMDTFGRLVAGHSYQVKIRGIRFGLLSMTPNIVKVYREIRHTNKEGRGASK